MPFDGVLALSKTPLADAMNRLGLRPIERSILDAHMADQIKRNKASWAFRYLNTIQLAIDYIAYTVTFGIIVGFFAGFTLEACGCHELAVWTAETVGGLLVCFVGLILFLLSSIRVRGPATWVIQKYRYGSQAILAAETMPAQVVKLITRIDDVHVRDRLSWTYGELRQNSVLLDPFISVCNQYSGEEAILAIWDGDTILHIASQQ